MIDQRLDRDRPPILASSFHPRNRQYFHHLGGGKLRPLPPPTSINAAGNDLDRWEKTGNSEC